MRSCDRQRTEGCGRRGTERLRGIGVLGLLVQLLQSLDRSEIGPKHGISSSGPERSSSNLGTNRPSIVIAKGSGNELRSCGGCRPGELDGLVRGLKREPEAREGAFSKSSQMEVGNRLSPT